MVLGTELAVALGIHITLYFFLFSPPLLPLFPSTSTSFPLHFYLFSSLLLPLFPSTSTSFPLYFYLFSPRLLPISPSSFASSSLYFYLFSLLLRPSSSSNSTFHFILSDLLFCSLFFFFVPPLHIISYLCFFNITSPSLILSIPHFLFIFNLFVLYSQVR